MNIPSTGTVQDFWFGEDFTTVSLSRTRLHHEAIECEVIDVKPAPHNKTKLALKSPDFIFHEVDTLWFVIA